MVERTGSSGGDSGWDVALTDGSVSTKSDLTNLSGDGSTYLTWDLGYTAVIDKFIVAQYMNYATGFEYYVSHEKDTLYNEENHVATYNITELFSQSSDHYEETVVFNEGSKPVGRYVGVRIIYLSENQSRLRVYEISAIGEAAPPELIPHNYKYFDTFLC